ncbi:MAG: hypothetical protein ACK2UX_08515, partial [Anaerolineae bacterium]
MERTEIRKRNPEFTDEVADAVDALRAGRRADARRALARVAYADPTNATAWYWLGRSMGDEERRAACMARVRRLDRERKVEAPQLPPERTASPRRAPAPQKTHPPKRKRWAIALALLFVAAACV